MRSKFIGSNQPCFVALVGCFVVAICRPISVVAEFLVQLLPMALLCLVLPCCSVAGGSFSSLLCLVVVGFSPGCWLCSS